VWLWEGKSPGFNETAFNKIAEFIDNYEESEIEDYGSGGEQTISFDGTKSPEERDSLQLLLLSMMKTLNVLC